MTLLNDLITAAFDGDQQLIDAFNAEIQAALDSPDPATLDLNLRLTPQGNGTSAVAIDMERRIKSPSKVGAFGEESTVAWDGTTVSASGS